MWVRSSGSGIMMWSCVIFTRAGMREPRGGALVRWETLYGTVRNDRTLGDSGVWGQRVEEEVAEGA